MAKLFNRAKMDTSTTGSGTITLGSAVDGYQSFADAGVADSDVVQYVIEDGNSWEIGTGTYSATGTSLTRTPSESSNSGAAISLTGAAEVFISAIHSDFEKLQNAGTTKVEATSTGATVTGDIVVTGTVDGRDIASDGLKLDGIESGATADQTKADIDALGINADQVDGLEASQFLRSDADDEKTGHLKLRNNAWYWTQYSSAHDEVRMNANTNGGLDVYNQTDSGFAHIKSGGLHINDDNTKLLEGSGNSLRVQTNSGYVDVGPMNTSWSHFSTDRTQFYFNKQIGVDGNLFPYTDSARTLGTSANRWSHIYGDALTTGAINSTSDSGVTVRSTTNAAGAKITFSDNAGGSYAQSGTLTYYHADGTVSSEPQTSNDGWIFAGSEPNTVVRVQGDVDVDQDLNVNSNIYVAGSLYHHGDTDTRLLFGTNTVTLQCGGSSEVTVNTTGVRLGDTGNGYFQPVTGNYGSIQIDGGAHSGYEGYSIGGRAVFMHNNNTATGIFNDVNNHWLYLAYHGGYASMYYAGSRKIETTSSGVYVTGTMNASSDIRFKKNIETIDGALEKVKSLRGITFDWDNDAFADSENTNKPNFTERSTGVIAQDVEKVLPEAVSDNEETGYKSVAYGNMVGLLIEAIKEQQTQIDALTAQVEELKRQ